MAGGIYIFLRGNIYAYLCVQVVAVVVDGSRAAGRRDHGHTSGGGVSRGAVRGAAAESVEELLGLSAFTNV